MCPLILFSSAIRSSPFLSDKFHFLDLILGPLGLIWSRNLTTPIPQRSHKDQFSIRISMPHIYKIYSQTLASRILLALPKEPITLLPEQESHTIESLLWIGLRNHSLSPYWPIHLVTPIYFVLLVLKNASFSSSKFVLLNLRFRPSFATEFVLVLRFRPSCPQISSFFFSNFILQNSSVLSLDFTLLDLRRWSKLYLRWSRLNCPNGEDKCQ